MSYFLDKLSPDNRISRSARGLQRFNGQVNARVDERESLAVRLAEIGGTGLLLGSEVWLLKSSSLLSSLLVSYPAWRGMDPLPVLLPKDEEQKKSPAVDKEHPKNPRFQLKEQTAGHR